MIFKKVIIILLSVLFLVACDNSKESSKPDELKFNVDEAKLGSEITNESLGVKFNPPLSWNAIDSTLIAKMKGQLKTQTVRNDSIKVTLKDVFMKQENRSLLSISKLSFNNSITSPKEFYDEKVTNKFSRASLFKRGEFLKDDIKFIQYLVQNGGNVNFKLLFNNEDNETIQFDYILNKKNYSNQLRAIESSIGSIKLIK